MRPSRPLTLILYPLLLSTTLAGTERNWKLVDITGTVEQFWFYRNWRAYYWRDDYSFLLREEDSGRLWRIISREPTPFLRFRLGPTYTGLKVDWTACPTVRVVGVRAIDRIPAEFYDFQLEPENTITAFLVWVKARRKFKLWYINNWFHRWGDQTDIEILKFYADKGKPYDVYGHKDGCVAPFSERSKKIIGDRNIRLWHGFIRRTRANPTGYEIELLHLFTAPSEKALLYGSLSDLPTLDQQKPPQP